MTESKVKSCRILTYGKDQTLLMTRKAVLESARFKCDTAHTAKDFLECIEASPRGYNIFILCHSVPSAEQQGIVESARGSGVEVYVLTTLTLPEQFIQHIQELAKVC